MANRKKSRKIGKIGISSVPKADRTPKKTSGKPKKKLGNPSGSRHNIVAPTVATNKSGGNKDPRVGSKKPVPLVVEDKPLKKVSAPKKTFFTPAQELASIENDQQLSALLDTLDKGGSLTQEQQQFVDSQLARHKALCDLLGVSQHAQEQEGQEKNKVSQETDLFDQFENIDISQFKSE